MDIISISMRSEQVTTLTLNRKLLQGADYIIRPEVHGLHWSRFDQIDELIDSGRQAGEAILQELKTTLKEHQSWKYKLRNWIHTKI